MNRTSRRRLLQTAAAAASAAAMPGLLPAASDAPHRPGRGRVKQSIAHWCFQKYWDIEKLCKIAVELGCRSIELVEPKDWPTLRKHGLVCALAASHSFDKGINNPKYHDMCLAKLREAVDACREAGFPNVITFTGFREDIPDDVGIVNCVRALKAVAAHAEKSKVNLCLEMLNSRVNVEMKGHPGYQGDHVDYCMEIIRKVGSERVKLLFDVYHVQIMDGDLIARFRQCKVHVGHVHLAGNPGRRELDDQQEINYAAVMRAIADSGYDGYAAHEFIPTGDPLQGLTAAVRLCDV